MTVQVNTYRPYIDVSVCLALVALASHQTLRHLAAGIRTTDSEISTIPGLSVCSGRALNLFCQTFRSMPLVFFVADIRYNSRQ